MNQASGGRYQPRDPDLAAVWTPNAGRCSPRLRACGQPVRWSMTMRPPTPPVTANATHA